MTLREFMRARLDEEERAAREIQHLIDTDAETVTYYNPTRVLAEVYAKRRIVELYEHVVDHGDARTSDPARLEVLEDVLRIHSLPHADHPDYDQAWRPAA